MAGRGWSQLLARQGWRGKAAASAASPLLPARAGAAMGVQHPQRGAGYSAFSSTGAAHEDHRAWRGTTVLCLQRDGKAVRGSAAAAAAAAVACTAAAVACCYARAPLVEGHASFLPRAPCPCVAAVPLTAPPLLVSCCAQVMIADGQVSMGDVVFKSNVKKVRRFGSGKAAAEGSDSEGPKTNVVAGFAGAYDQ
jgi:hypothetical protein